MNILGGIKILWMFLGALQNWTIFRGHFYVFQDLFFKVKAQKGGYFWGVAEIFIFFVGVLEILDIFGVNGRYWAQAFI